MCGGGGVGTVGIGRGSRRHREDHGPHPAVTAMHRQGRTVFGVAATAAAAEVLASETGMDADTVDKFLFEHTRRDRPPDERYVLPVGATVIVDEAGTLSTPHLAQLARLADHHQWRMVMVGDPRQFSAVGRGGMFSHLTATCGAIELDQVHRFESRWERAASLRLRNGDPTVLIDYDRRGRLHDGTPQDMDTAIIEAWRQARGRGEEVAVLANRKVVVRNPNVDVLATNTACTPSSTTSSSVAPSPLSPDRTAASGTRPSARSIVSAGLASTAAPTSITAVTSIPLPRNTVAKKRSSRSPTRRRMTATNQRKEMAAMIDTDKPIVIEPRCAASPYHDTISASVAEGSGDRVSKVSPVTDSIAKARPATAAASMDRIHLVIADEVTAESRRFGGHAAHAPGPVGV